MTQESTGYQRHMAVGQAVSSQPPPYQKAAPGFCRQCRGRSCGRLLYSAAPRPTSSHGKGPPSTASLQRERAEWHRGTQQLHFPGSCIILVGCQDMMCAGRAKSGPASVPALPEAGGHTSTEPSGSLPHCRAMGCPHLQRLAGGAGQGALMGSDWATCPSGIPPRAIALPHYPLELLLMDSYSLKPS